MRAAVYFTPPADDALTRRAAEWLGRDAFSGAPTRAPDPAIDPLVSEPVRYGFHATMKAPFRLAEGTDLDLLAADFEMFCQTTAGAMIAQLKLSRTGRFFALIPTTPEPALQALAERIVRHFEAYRAPMTATERARRRPDALSDRQRQFLDEWGYPYVFEEYGFHMTLTGPVADEAAAATDILLRARFAEFVAVPLAIDGLALFVEPQNGGPFRIHAHHALQTTETTAL